MLGLQSLDTWMRLKVGKTSLDQECTATAVESRRREAGRETSPHTSVWKVGGGRVQQPRHMWVPQVVWAWLLSLGVVVSLYHVPWPCRRPPRSRPAASAAVDLILHCLDLA